MARDRLGRRSLVAARSAHGGTDARCFTSTGMDLHVVESPQSHVEREEAGKMSVTCHPSHDLKAASPVRLVAL